MPLSALPDAFRLHFGFALRPLQYETNSLEELVAKLRSHVQVVYSERGAELSLIDQNALSQAKNQVLQLLYPIIDGSMPLHRLLEQYKEICGHECPLSFITNHMEEIIEVDNDSFTEPMVRLVPLMLFSRQVHLLLNENGGRLPLSNFESAFVDRFGSVCRPSQYGHSNSTTLLQSLAHIVVLRGKGLRRVIVLSRDVEDLTPPSISRAPKTSEIKPPAHWLIPKVEKKTTEVEETIPKSEVYEDLKQLFFNTNASSSVIEDIATTCCQGTPPAASLLPRPSLTMTASLTSEEEMSKSNPIKSRIAAQFRNPVKPID